MSMPNAQENLAETIRKHKPRKKALRLIAVISVLLIAGIYYAFKRNNSDESIHYQVTTVTRGDLKVTVDASGTLEPTNVVTIGSELSGIISTVNVDINDHVKKGDVLAQLDPSKLNDSIVNSSAALEAARAFIAQAEATLKETTTTLDRLKSLAKMSNNRLPAKSDMDSAQAAYARAMADKTSAQAAVSQAEAALNSDQTNLEKATIRSPIDGVILTRTIEPGQTVAASLSAPTLFTIAEDLSKMELHVDIDEADVGQVKNGQNATFTVDAWPGRTYQAALTRVSYGSTITDNVVTYEGILSVDNPDLSLRPGMTANATINTELKNNVLLIPNTALRFSPPEEINSDSSNKNSSVLSSLLPHPPRNMFRSSRATAQTKSDRDESIKTIYILKDQMPVAITVKKGATDGTQTEVESDNLSEGQAVIISSSTGTNSSSDK